MSGCERCTKLFDLALKAEDAAADARVRLEEAQRLLSSAEWAGDTMRDICPICEGRRDDDALDGGHVPGCKLNAYLSRPSSREGA